MQQVSGAPWDTLGLLLKPSLCSTNAVQCLHTLKCTRKRHHVNAIPFVMETWSCQQEPDRSLALGHCHCRCNIYYRISSEQPQCKQYHTKGNLTLPLYKLLKPQAGLQDRNTQSCPCCSPFPLVMKPLYKIFRSQQFQPPLPKKLPTSCQSRFIQANLLPTYLLCPLQNSDTVPLCPTPTRQLCPLSGFSVPF